MISKKLVLHALNAVICLFLSSTGLAGDPGNLLSTVPVFSQETDQGKTATGPTADQLIALLWAQSPFSPFDATGHLVLKAYVSERPAPLFLFDMSFDTSATKYDFRQDSLNQLDGIFKSLGLKSVTISTGSQYYFWDVNLHCTRNHGNANCTLIDNNSISINSTSSFLTEVPQIIGRCSFDPQTATDPDNEGLFRTGNAIANFYKDSTHVFVKSGVSWVSGRITDKTDLIGNTRGDQAESWTSHNVALTRPGIPFKASWIDDQALQANPAHPTNSIIAYDWEPLSQIRNVPANGSYIQNFVVGVGNAYPTCIFWVAP